MGISHNINENVFRQIHGNSLVYNACWEDPRCDRQLLNLNSESRIVMLTSAGCNALDYLLDDPAAIHCVDINPRQNALLLLKIALLEEGSHATLFEFFGNGVSPRAKEIFYEGLRKRLPDAYATLYWERNLHYFSGKGLRKSFYWHGSCGTVAWIIRQWILSRPEAARLMMGLFEAKTVHEQADWYNRLEPLFLNGFVQWLVRQHLVQSMLGVPKSQQYLAATLFPDGMAGYIRQCLRHVFTELPLADNYFWKLYFFGRYEADCCPNYLKKEYFDTLQSRSARIDSYTGTLSDYLKKHPGRYTHFVLLDHQDWLAAKRQRALDEEWQLIIENAAPGARVLFRTAAFNPEFLPAFVRERVRFDPVASARSQANDRVGTYAGTWLGEI
ncbi:MAG: BtaA family protein [Lewinellaceae bacterium]|nr:BtaA family protein [Lewinellaceae bacterium]